MSRESNKCGLGQEYRGASPLASVIIVNYNGEKYLKKCFDSLEKGTYRNFEIIFVDNGSKDGSVELVKQGYPRIKVIENKENLGLSIASNRGAALAKEEYLFFLNNDTISHPDLLSELVKTAENNPKIGVCACKNMTYDGREEVSLGLSCDVFGFPFENEGPIFYADAGIFIRRSVFDEIGGFDEKLFLYGEDRDLCWRVLLQGYEIVGVPTAVFYHDSFCTHVSTQGGYVTNIRKRYLCEYNMIRSMLKNYSLGVLLLLFACYVVLTILEMLLLLFKGKLKVIFSVYLRAYWQNLLDFPDTLRYRHLVQKIRKVSDSFILSKMIKRSGKIHIFRKIGLPRFTK